MAHPYDNNAFRHFIKFYDFNMDWYEICEPVGFNGAKYIKRRLKSGLWARDVEYFAVEGLTFPNKDSGKRLENPRVFNPQGDISNYMDYGYYFLEENRRLNGSEMKVGYKVQLNNIDFDEFEFDTQIEDVTDGETYFNANLISISKVADHFRNLKNTFNAFSDKNWKGETITPIESFNYLVKATPLNLISEFKMSAPFEYTTPSLLFFDTMFINPAQNITESQINNTLGWVAPTSTEQSDFGLIEVVKELTDVTVTIEVDIRYRLIANDATFSFEIGNSTIGFQTLFYVDDASGTITQTYTIKYDSIQNGQRLYCSLQNRYFSNIKIDKFNIKIEAIETDIDMVCPAVTYFDLIRQGAKYVNDLPVVFTNFDQFKNQAVFTRSLLEQRKELYTTNEDLQQSLQEYCADVEISKDNINIRQHQDFYENVEIGSFLVIPSDDYSEPFDETYLINNFGYGYKDYEQDRTVKGTSFGVHTFAEFLPKNLRADKSKKIENELIRDYLLKQSVFNLAIKTPSTSTEKDEKLFIEDMVELAPNTTRTFVRTLLMRWQNGKLEILNRNTLGTNTDAILNWNNIGLGIGVSFEILSGANVGNYTINSIKADGSVLSLNPIGTITQVSGNYTIRIKHRYTNVQWQTRTTEGFSIAPKGYSNLAYTIKRNMRYWYYYLATATMYCKKDIVNSFFKNFGKLETQLDTETSPVIEDATILYSDLPKPLVEPITVNAKIVAQYDDVVEYLENYRTVKGFIRLFNPNGKVVKVYPKNFEYTLSSSEADIQGEKKYEDEFLRIDIVANVAIVNDAPYDLRGVAEWFRTQNDYIQLYDKKSQPLSNFYRYDFVFLNGNKYTSIAELVNQLNTVQWT